MLKNLCFGCDRLPAARAVKRVYNVVIHGGRLLTVVVVIAPLPRYERGAGRVAVALAGLSKQTR